MKGWNGGKTWMNTMTLITRANFANTLTGQMSQRGQLSPRLHHGIAAYGTAPGGVGTPEQMVDAVWGLLLAGPNAGRGHPFGFSGLCLRRQLVVGQL